MRRSLSKFLKHQRELPAPKQSGFVRFSGVTIPKKKPHGNETMIIEKTTHTYLLAIPNLVVRMTIWVGQGQSHLPADVPGITTVLGQRGRLQPKGRLHQQPAGDLVIRSPSRQRRRSSSNGRFTESGMALTRSTEVGDQRDASHARPPPTNGQEPPP
jgi:hypothetical protein